MNSSRATANAAASADWAHASERSNQFMLGVMRWISLRLGRRVSRLVLFAIATYFSLFAPAARRASAEYLSKVLGRRSGFKDHFRHVLSFASTIHDRVYLLNDRLNLFDIEIEGLEHVDALVAQGRGGFLMGAHFGSFEVQRALARTRSDIQISMLMYEENARKIGAALHAINPSASQDIIALGRFDSMLRLHERLDEGALVGILADRSLRDDDRLILPFLGQPAPWPRGPMRLAALLRRPVLFMAGIYLGGNRYVVRFKPLADFSGVRDRLQDTAVNDAIRAYVEQLQAGCREAPSNWYNFYNFWKDVPQAD